MSAILPPSERLWYKHPIDRVEGTWIVIALTWCLVMFAMMVGWHVWGRQNLSTETYRLHLTAMDYNHGFSLQPANINIQMVPGFEHVVTVTPNQSGTYSVVCNEYCGIGHHTMVGRVYIK